MGQQDLQGVPVTEVAYSYRTLSTLAPTSGGARLDLATSGGSVAGSLVQHPFFFSGFVEHPDVVAQSLLLLARVARTRFFLPPNTLAAVLRAADPVVTSTPEGLRFESFSVCCGVYARLDVDAGALDATHCATGVTNVDVNPPLRHALAGLRASEPLHLNVGADELQVSTLDGTVIEERVRLSGRWLKGFAETQRLSAGMTLLHQLDAPATRRFVQALPRSSASRTVMWATRAGGGLRLASRTSPGAVCVAGPERLRVLEPLLRFATALRAYGPETDTSPLPLPSAWILDLPGARMTVALSPEKSRGFSGEGSVLHSLTGDTVGDDADLLSALLAFEPRIEPAGLSAETGLPEPRIIAALTMLAMSGQVGFDLAAGRFFHRPLPVPAGSLDTVHPRLAAAHKLVADGSVRQEPGGLVTVRSSDQHYRVVLGTSAHEDRCTCPWYGKYFGTRGPCKHVLAARIAADRGPT